MTTELSGVPQHVEAARVLEIEQALLRIPSSAFQEQQIAESISGIRLDDGTEVELDETVTGVVVLARAPTAELELSDDAREFVRSEWKHFLDSLEPCSRSRWVNPPAAARKAESKAHQLAVARAAGLRIPRTSFTNDPKP